MIERIAEMQARVQRSRAALDAMAERAAELRARLEVGQQGSNGADAGHGAGLAASLHRLTQVSARVVDDDGGGDGEFVSDAWEIALINEEGK